MYDHRNAALHRPFTLNAKRLHLLLPELLVPVKVDPYLAYRHIIGATVKLGFDKRQILFPIAADLGGMQPHRYRRAVAER